jgi:capsular polysaccharide biosynthesis protein
MRLRRPARQPESTATLAGIASAEHWADGPPSRFYCGQVGARLRKIPNRNGTVAVVGGASVPAWARVLQTFLPMLNVVEVDAAAPPDSSFLTLAALAPLDAMVDASDTAGMQREAFLRTFRHLAPGAPYLARLLPGEDDLWSLLSEAQAARVAGFPEGDETDLAWLVRCIESIEIRARVLVVVPARPGRAKIREEEVDALLALRPDLGSVVDEVPALTMVSQCEYDDNASARDPFLLREFPAPAMKLRCYDGATATPKQVVTGETVVLPDTFRYNTTDRLVNIYLDDYAPRFADPHMPMDRRRELPGAWFHLDSEAPGAFGHFITEQLPRLWALEAARREEPGLRLLLSLTKDRHGRLAPFELDILGAYGITEADVLVIDRPVRVERLYAATPMYSFPDRSTQEGGLPYVHPGVADVWSRIGDHLATMAGDVSAPRRIFCARRAGGRRTCHNGAEVEALFARHGFTVVHPEDHPMPEQLAMFRAAEVVGGYAGSAMFTLAMCPDPKRVIALAPDAYTGRNEYAISALWGHRLTTVWSKSDVPHPPDAWTREAFWSGFTFDFEREGRFLQRTLADLGSSGST